MVYSHWSGYRADSVAHTHSVVQVKVRRSFRVSLEALVTFLVFFAVALALAGCSTGAAKLSSSNSQTPIIWVAMGQNPPGYMVTGTSTQVSAWVYNDLANAGVDWVVTCGNPGHCGSFSPTHSASGANTTFTAPTAVPPNSTLTISALSTTDHSKSAYASVHISSTVTGIVITIAPQAPVPANAIVSLSAIVFGDPANLGVDWTATCVTPSGPADCSSPNFSSRFGADNNNIIYTVPSTLTTLGGVVSLVGTQITITARPTADHSWSAQSVFTVTAPISISMTQPPPPTMQLKATAQVAAVVTNDTFGEGVTWSVACTSNTGDCGSITPTQTGSGVAVTYTAPASVPSSPVTIEADATATSLAVDCGQAIGIACQKATATVNVVAPISVSITQSVPNGTIIQNASAPLIATVTNDPSNAGVDWAVTCGSPGACGTFSPAHTASGAPTTYTAPGAPPGGNNTVTITATSTADPTKSDQQNVTVFSAPPLLQGQFVLYLNAQNSQNGPFVLGGVITGDGQGNISRGRGHFELVDASGNATISIFVTSPSSYSIGSDGRGQMTLTIDLSALKSDRPNANFGVPVPGTSTSTLTLSVVFVSEQVDASGVVLSEHALVAETDTFGDATGTLDLQNAADLASFSGGSADFNGTYSLQLTGAELASQYPAFFEAAALTIQSSGSSCTITGYTADQSADGVITSVPFATGSQVLPNCLADSLGNGEIFSNIPVNLGLPQQFYLDFWLIDKNHFVVTDPFDQPGPVLFGGYLTAQPTSPSLSGTLAFTEAGATAASSTTPGQPQVAGGIITCGSTGTVDVVSLGGTPLTSQTVSATCSAPANGRGTIMITGAGSTGVSQFAAYPAIDGNFYLLELDGGSAGTSGPSGAGVAYAQTVSPPVSASALSGNYGSQFFASTQLGSQAFVGQVISDGVQNITGTVDVNSFATSPAPGTASPSPGATLTNGTYTAGTDGTLPLKFTIAPAAGQPTPQIPTLSPACYIVDANMCLLLGLDATAPGTGILQLQKDLP